MIRPSPAELQAAAGRAIPDVIAAACEGLAEGAEEVDGALLVGPVDVEVRLGDPETGRLVGIASIAGWRGMPGNAAGVVVVIGVAVAGVVLLVATLMQVAD